MNSMSRHRRDTNHLSSCLSGEAFSEDGNLFQDLVFKVC